MRKPQGDFVAVLRDLSWRRGALRVGYLVLLFVGLELLANRDGLGVVYILAGGLGFALAHRRIYSVLVWSGVAVHGAWLFISGNQLGLWGVVGGLIGAVIGWLPESSLRIPVSLLDALQGLQVEHDKVVLEPAMAVADAVRPPAAVLEPVVAPVVSKPVVSDVLVVRSIGGLQLSSAGQDVTPELERAAVVSFTWLYLMARAVVDEGYVSRKEVAAALTPLKMTVNPAGRLREHLRAIKALPEPIARVIVSTAEVVRFDAEACDWDVARLRRLRAACAEWGGEVIPREVLSELEQELAALAPGEFLPGWDVKERFVLNGNPLEDLIRDVRLNVTTLRADLTATLGASLLAHGRAADAVAPLEAERVRSADPRVVESLIKALHETGQHDRAAELRRKFDRGEVC